MALHGKSFAMLPVYSTAVYSLKCLDIFRTHHPQSSGKAYPVLEIGDFIQSVDFNYAQYIMNGPSLNRDVAVIVSRADESIAVIRMAFTLITP